MEDNPSTNLDHEDKIRPSHDSFANQSFSDLNIAKALFRSQLPAGILARVDLESLQIVPSSYVETICQSFSISSLI